MGMRGLVSNSVGQQCSRVALRCTGVQQGIWGRCMHPNRQLALCIWSMQCCPCMPYSAPGICKPASASPREHHMGDLNGMPIVHACSGNCEQKSEVEGCDASALRRSSRRRAALAGWRRCVHCASGRCSPSGPQRAGTRHGSVCVATLTRLRCWPTAPGCLSRMPPLNRIAVDPGQAAIWHACSFRGAPPG